MKRYRTVFSFASRDSNPTLFYEIHYSTDGQNWFKLNNQVYTADVANRIVEDIIAGEREWVKVPVNVTHITLQ